MAIALSERKGFNTEDFASLHPGGKLGKRLMRVENLMHTGDQVPRVDVNTPMRDVIYEISRKGLGMTCVVKEEGIIAGIITDGDLRRLLQREENILIKTAGECMNPHPRMIDRGALAVTALQIMEERKITSLPVASETGKIEGVLHLHDLWEMQMF